ncbi:hypothetical protein ACFRAO_20070 [Streptomyces sp. NPDC056656]|uniref:hypothetical protein n=1 Tax=Streptomyces sp. NPDC056656 TaxID=3345895 RepID=UPI0036BAC91C
MKTVHAAFPLACVDGEVSTIYNMVNMSGTDKEGTVAVTAPSAVHWSMTIGRGEPPKEERQGNPQHVAPPQHGVSAWHGHRLVPDPRIGR